MSRYGAAFVFRRMAFLRRMPLSLFLVGQRIGAGSGLTRIPPIRCTRNLVYRFVVKSAGVVAVNFDDRWLFVEGKDSGLTPHVLLNKVHERTETALFKTLVGPGSTFVDVGAHVGYYTTLAARLVEPNGQVFALEPVPSNFDLLNRAVIKNGYDNVKTFQMAASNATGRADLMHIPGHTGAGMLFRPRIEGRTYISVETVILDELLTDVPIINLIKIDVEGAELAVIEGLEKTIMRSREVKLLMEFSPGLYRRQGRDPNKFLTSMIGKGFSIFEIDEVANKLKNIPNTDLLDLTREGRPNTGLYLSRGSGQPVIE